MKLVCISDTHGYHRHLEIPPGDILIHAGDFTRVSSHKELPDFNDWLSELSHPFKVVIAGNHDWCFETEPGWARRRVKKAIYLQDSSRIIGGLKIYGSPWQPLFYGWAFNLHRGEPLKKVWGKIPVDTDILVTHGPPANIGDLTSRGDRMGCEHLAEAIERIRPKIHICGHNHEGYGIVEKKGIIYVNASICTAKYHPTNRPIVVDL